MEHLTSKGISSPHTRALLHKGEMKTYCYMISFWPFNSLWLEVSFRMPNSCPTIGSILQANNDEPGNPPSLTVDLGNQKHIIKKKKKLKNDPLKKQNKNRKPN